MREMFENKALCRNVVHTGAGYDGGVLVKVQ